MKFPVRTLFLSTAAVTLLTSTVSIASQDFLANVDARIKTESVSQNRLVSERFFRLMARLSVYALYCDAANTLKYSQRFHDVYVSCMDLQAQAEETFGGFKAAYNKFEKQRNEESLRFIQSADRAAVCSASYPAFAHYVSLSGKAMKAELLSTPVGEL